MIRFSARGAYLPLVPQERALIQDMALICFFKTTDYSRITETRKLTCCHRVLLNTAIATNFEEEITHFKELCSHMDIICPCECNN